MCEKGLGAMFAWARQALAGVFGRGAGEPTTIHVTELVVRPSLVRGDGDARLRLPAGAELTIEVRIGPVRQGQRVQVVVWRGQSRRVVVHSQPTIVEADAAGIYPRLSLPPLPMSRYTYRLVVLLDGRPVRYRRVVAVAPAQ